jgi:DUF4097 and DUF4098 domain-containing protein YvlB
MHKFITAIFLISAAATLHAADADPDAVTVPLHDPSKPATIHAQMMMGGITIRGEDRKDISVESHTRFRDDNHERNEPRPDGMKRLDLSGANGLDIKEENNVVTIKTDVFNKGGDLIVAVPLKSSLKLKCLNGGDIEVENVTGEIEAENLNGAISLKDVSGSVIAHSLNGAVTADIKNADPSKPMSFSTLNGNIDVTLPANIKANVSLKTDNGEILSDFDVKLEAKAAPVEKSRDPDGAFHVRIDKTLHGSINGGGPEFLFRSFNGQIFIRKRK